MSCRRSYFGSICIRIELGIKVDENVCAVLTILHLGRRFVHVTNSWGRLNLSLLNQYAL